MAFEWTKKIIINILSILKSHASGKNKAQALGKLSNVNEASDFYFL